MAAAAVAPPPADDDDDDDHPPAQTDRLADDTYAVLVHRNHADRVRDAVLTTPADCSDSGWTTLQHAPDAHDESSSPPAEEAACDADTDTSSAIVIPTPHEKGRRKSRRGYSLLVLTKAKRSPATLPATARVQISWAGRLTHRTAARRRNRKLVDGVNRVDGGDGPSSDELVNDLAHAVHKELLGLHVQSDGGQRFDPSKDRLRVDVHPKSMTENVCRALQTAAAAVAASARVAVNSAATPTAIYDATDPFDGPLSLTRSATHASYVVNIVHSPSPPTTSTSTSSTKEEYYWGISTSTQNWSELNGKLNDNARVWVEPTCPVSGVDLLDEQGGGGAGGGVGRPMSIPPEAPASRAYYKLEQVFDDYLNSYVGRIGGGGGGGSEAGLDLGASPGGWTQILATKVGMDRVVSVDRAILAKRVEDLPGVVHVRHDFNSDVAVRVMASSAPYRAVVCDASTDSFDVLEQICATMEKVSRELGGTGRGGDSGGSSKATRSLFALPAVMVVTLKMPFKSTESLRRNLGKALGPLTETLHRIETSGAPGATIKYKVVHLMANSESERTVIVVFE